MKAALYKNKNEIRLDEIDSPVLVDRGAIIKVEGCGLCGSDIVKLREGLVPEDTVLGHEIVGSIVEINIENSNFKVKDKVVAGHHVPCFECVYCSNENYSMCRTFKETNIVPGGFAEYIYVSESHLSNTVFKIPEGLPEIDASFVEPSACSLRAIKRANIKLGDNVLIVGLGSIGLILGQIAKHYGAFVSGCDILDERLEMAKILGFDNIVKFSNLGETVAKYLNKPSSVGADAVFLASGNEKSIDTAISCVRDGGSIIVFSSIHSDKTGFTNNDIYYRELKVMGSYSPAPADLGESLELIKNNIIKVGDFSKVYPLEKINEAISDTVENKIIKAYIKL